MVGATGAPLQMDIALPHAIFQREKLLPACLHDFLFQPVLCEEGNVPDEVVSEISCTVKYMTPVILLYQIKMVRRSNLRIH